MPSRPPPVMWSLTCTKEAGRRRYFRHRGRLLWVPSRLVSPHLATRTRWAPCSRSWIAAARG